jgi:hypothetical protein
MKSAKLNCSAQFKSSSEMDTKGNVHPLKKSRHPNYKAFTNEIAHPYVVEVAVVSDGLNIELTRRIMQFHKSRHVEPRYGRRRTTTRGKIHYGWCFSDLVIARAFAEQFDGRFRKSRIGPAAGTSSRRAGQAHPGGPEGA